MTVLPPLCFAVDYVLAYDLDRHGSGSAVVWVIDILVHTLMKTVPPRYDHNLKIVLYIKHWLQKNKRSRLVAGLTLVRSCEVRACKGPELSPTYVFPSEVELCQLALHIRARAHEKSLSLTALSNVSPTFQILG